MFFSENNILSYMDLVQDISAYNLDLSEIEDRNKGLLMQLNKLKTDLDYIEEYSRSNFSMLKKQETLYFLDEK